MKERTEMIYPSHRHENWGLEYLRNMSNTTQLYNNKAWIEPVIFLTIGKGTEHKKKLDIEIQEERQTLNKKNIQ